jgi:putative peptidoglycan lipid II flippase
MATKQIAKSATIVSAITMLSRVLGYVRDAICAALLGVSAVSDAFYVAFRIPNMLRNLLAEGALSSAFIPVFTDYLEKKDKKDVWLLAANVMTILTLILVVITALGVTFADPLVRIMAPGFSRDPFKFNLTVDLTRWLFPFILFISMAALLMGILNSLKKFSMPAFAPVILNVAMITSGVFICPALGAKPEQQVYGWVIGALAGAVLQVAIQWIPAARDGFKWKFFIDLREEGVRRIGKLMIPATIAQSVTQINLLVNTILASFLTGGAVTYLYYGNRLMQLPFGVFGVAIATVAFPYISEYASRRDTKSLCETIHSSLKQAFFIVIPCSAGMIFLSQPINALLFHYGRFTMEDTIHSANVSALYCIAIFAFSGIKILTQVFYAIDKASTAVKISTASMIINVLLCVGLMFPMNYLGLALATSIAGIVQFFLLYYYVEKYTGDIKTKELVIFSVKIAVISVIMGALVFVLSKYLNTTWNHGLEVSRKMNGIIVLVCMIAGTAIYAVLLFVFRVREAGTFVEYFKNRIR